MNYPPTEQSRRKRRWYQFSLRTLLIFTLVSGTALGFFGIEWQAARRQEEAVAAVLAAGGTVYYDYQYDQDGNFLSNAAPPGPEWMRDKLGIDFFASVHNVELNRSVEFDFRAMKPQDPKEIDWVLAQLPAFKKLRWLDLICVDLGSRDLSPIEDLTQLERLDLHGSGVSDSQLDQLSALTQLKRLGFAGCPITDAGLAHLKDLRNLRMLNLCETSITNEGIRQLERCPDLEVLWLDHTLVTDPGIVRLVSKISLLHLSVSSTYLTDACVDALLQTHTLRELNISSPLVSWKGFTRLRDGLSPCPVRYQQAVGGSIIEGFKTPLKVNKFKIERVNGNQLVLSPGTHDGIKEGINIEVQRDQKTIAKGKVLKSSPIRALAQLTKLTEKTVELTDDVIFDEHPRDKDE